MPTGVILAGGGSVRMGRPKSLLPVHGVPIIERVAARLRTVCEELVVVANDPALAGGIDARIVADDVLNEGPLRGIEAGLDAAAHDPCVVVACDMPFVERAVIARLLELAAHADAAVPRWTSGRREAGHGVYSRSCLPAIRDALRRGDRKATAFLDAVRVAYLDEPEWRRLDPHGRSFWNVNTPADLEEAESVPD